MNWDKNKTDKDMIMKLPKLITDINTNIFCITSYNKYAKGAFYFHHYRKFEFNKYPGL